MRTFFSLGHPFVGALEELLGAFEKVAWGWFFLAVLDGLVEFVLEALDLLLVHLEFLCCFQKPAHLVHLLASLLPRFHGLRRDGAASPPFAFCCPRWPFRPALG